MADEAAQAEKPAKGEKSGIPLVPLILVMLLIPVITLVLTEFVIIPRLQSSMGTDGSSDHADASDHGSSSGGGHSASSEEGDSHGGGGGGGHGGTSSDSGGDSGGGGIGYEFKDVICNLAGTMGTRFLKVSFEVAGSDPDLPTMIRTKKPRVQDSIITTLSSKTIQDIEVPGGRHALKVALITAINQAIGFSAVEELYFTEFIIQ